ncbi:uncharacterized protein LOC115219036 isoform X2 [Octopus sinensis]|uniref:Uncharacterized protein LOC115219036 isoform X2 n=1 Tax=Octopus sinensis TaxID=2607531 RepID=A0A7E6FA16_9MOLL|nr:uncharacterized protein LOC115219036 isoform X2 [Octopus sinensis]
MYQTNIYRNRKYAGSPCSAMEEVEEVTFSYYLPAGCTGIRYTETGGKLDPLCLVDLVCAADENEYCKERKSLQDRSCLQPSQLRPFGYGLLRHGNMFEDIHSYFKMYLFKPTPKLIQPANRPEPEQNRNSNFSTPLINDTQNAVTPRTEQEILNYTYAVLCANYPFLVLSICGIVKNSLDNGQSSFRYSMIFQPVFAEETNLKTVSLQLIFYLRSAFGFQMSEHTASLNSKQPELLLADDLGTRLSLLERNVNTFYQPEQFTNNNYENWKKEERSLLGFLLQMIGRNNIPKVKDDSTLRLSEIHSHYQCLSERLFLYDKKCLEMTGNQPYVYSNYSAYILEEFGLRYGVGFLYRLIVYLDLLVKYFDQKFSKIKHIYHTLQTIWSTFPEDKQNLTATQKEIEMLQEILSKFFLNAATFLHVIIKSEQTDAEAIDSMIKSFNILHQLSKYLNDIPNMLEMKTEIYCMTQRMFLKLYEDALTKFSKSSSCENSKAQLTLTKISDVINCLEQEICLIEKFKPSFEFDIVDEAKKCLFKYLMNDIQNIFRNENITAEKVDLYHLVEHIYHLDSCWGTSLSENLNIWKVMLMPSVIEKVKETYQTLCKITEKSLTLDQFKPELFSVVEKSNEMCGKSCVPQLMGWKHVLSSVVSNAEVISLANSKTHPLLSMMPTNSLLMSQKEMELILKSKQKQEDKDETFQRLCKEAVIRNCCRSNSSYNQISASSLHLAFKMESSLPSEDELVKESNQVWKQFLQSKATPSDEEEAYHQTPSHKCNHSTAKSTYTNADSSTQKSRIQLCFAADYASLPKEEQFAVFLPMSSSVIDIITQLNRFLHLGKYWHQRLCTSLSSCSKSWMNSGTMDLYNTFLEFGILLIVNYARSLLKIDAVNFLKENPKAGMKIPSDTILRDSDQLFKNFETKNSLLYQQFSSFYFTKKVETREKILTEIQHLIEMVVKDRYSKQLCVRLNNLSMLVKLMSVYCESLTRIFHVKKIKISLNSETPENYCCKLPHVVNWLCHCQEELSKIWVTQCKILASMVSQFLSKSVKMVLSSCVEKSVLGRKLGPLTAYINCLLQQLRQWLYPCSYNHVISSIIISVLQTLSTYIKQIPEMHQREKIINTILQLTKLLQEMVYSLTDHQIQESLLQNTNAISFKLNLHLMPTIKLARLLWSINVQIQEDCPHCFSISKMKLILTIKQCLQPKQKSFQGLNFILCVSRFYAEIQDLYEIVLPKALRNAGTDDIIQYISEEFFKILVTSGHIFEINETTSEDLFGINEPRSDGCENVEYPEVSLQQNVSTNISRSSLLQRTDSRKLPENLSSSQTFLSSSTDVFQIPIVPSQLSESETFHFKRKVHQNCKEQAKSPLKNNFTEFKYTSLGTPKNCSYPSRNNTIKRDAMYTIRPLNAQGTHLQWPTYFISVEPKFDVKNSEEFFDLIATFFSLNLSPDVILDILSYRSKIDSVAKDCMYILNSYFKTSK